MSRTLTTHTQKKINLYIPLFYQALAFFDKITNTPTTPSLWKNFENANTPLYQGGVPTMLIANCVNT